MAGKSLGTLTIDLIAEVGGFVRGMDKAERASDAWQKKISKDAAIVGTAIGAAVSAVAAGTISLIKSTSDHVTETDRWAKSLGVSTSALMQWQYAAEKAGLSGDNIADIFKDLNDKIGDAVLNKSGEAAQALDTLGLSAKKLQNIGPDKALLAIAKAMDGMNVAEKTNIYESLGNDLTKLMPLLNDGAKGLDDLKTKATDLGIAPDDADIEKLVAVNKVFQDWGDSIDGFKNRFVVALSQIDLSPINESLNNIESVLTNPATLQGMSNLVSGALDLANFVSKVAAGLGNIAQLTGQRTAALSGKINESDKGQVSQRIEFLDATGSGDSDEANRLKNRLNFLNALPGKIKDANQAAHAAKGLQSMLKDMGINDDNPYSLKKGDTNGKPPKPPKPKVDHAALKLDNSFASTEQAYLKQIALIDTTGKKSAVVTEQQKLAFDLSTGKLAGLNDLQQKRLQSLAAEVDRLNAVKKANEDNAKVAAYVATLNESNANNKQGLDADFIGAGMGDKTRDRLKQLASIRQDFTNQQFELNKQYSEDGNKDAYDKESAALKSALEQRLQDQQDYYDNIDKLSDNWQDGVTDGLKNFVDENSNYMQMATNATSDILNGLSSSITDNFTSILNGTESFKKGMSSLISELGQNVIHTLIQMATQALITKAIMGIGGSLFGGGAAAGYSGTAVSSIGSSLDLGVNLPGFSDGGFTGSMDPSQVAGIVHGKEFVFDAASTSRIGVGTLEAMRSGRVSNSLNRVASESRPSSTFSPNMTFHVNGNPSDAQIAMMKKAASDGARQGYQMSVNSIATQSGSLHKAMMAKTNAGVKKT
ncbi:phage tail tape measure protein [Rosenbergiella sp. S61]|uniref:Phage tail tape measure protein n=1 Tax=Rosenbergiella gaditana TaxID=2726987 RepID=A0ABS5SYI2_9GAMM|nr:phage tail tape measure protein [Rosenbergiella gaditana]MBT0725161.1 phage tail tape measure protein [Rosenbergiella gaditana]